MSFCIAPLISLFQLFVVAPKIINRNQYKEQVTLKIGTSHKIEILFVGSPQPSASWSFNRFPQRHFEVDTNVTMTLMTLYDVQRTDLPQRRFDVDTNVTMTLMTLYDLQRTDSGIYTVVIENDLGKDKLDVEVDVVGKISH